MRVPRPKRPRRGELDRIKAAISGLRASRCPPVLVVPTYQGDDTAAALRWIEGLETAVRAARAETVVIVIEKVGARPSSDPAPWASSAAAAPPAHGSDATTP